MDGGDPVTHPEANIVIDIGAEFSPYPSGRFPADGQHNGQVFRETLLAPALDRAIEAGTNVIVDIDGVRTFGSSFLEEAFAGLVRLGRFSRSEVRKHISIRCSKPHLSFFQEEIEDLLASSVPEHAKAS